MEEQENLNNYYVEAVFYSGRLGCVGKTKVEPDKALIEHDPRNTVFIGELTENQANEWMNNFVTAQRQRDLTELEVAWA